MNEQGARTAPDAQEIDVWWGAYSGLTLLPSLLVCIVLTGVIAWSTRTFIERAHVQWSFWALAGLVWLVQTYRWSWRVFGVNYRLTTRRLLIHRGWWTRLVGVELDDVAGVYVKRPVLGRWFRVGQVIVLTKDGGRVVLDSVHEPLELAGRLRERMSGKKINDEARMTKAPGTNES